MKQVTIKIAKTARYFISTEPSEDIKTVWFVCHGYAQLASYFINWFEPIMNKETLIIAPEGLHRFYWNGFSGNVVASWMTKEERTSDIEDYVNYLDQTSAEILKQLPDNVKINVLGFSQGTSTVCRWIANGNIKPDNLIIWAGGFRDDTNYFERKEIFDSINIHFAIGDKDQFFTEETVQKELERLKNTGMKFHVTRYKGGHKILQEPLLEVAALLK